MDAITLAALLGGISTFTVAVLTRAKWSNQTKRIIAIGTVIISVLIGLLIHGFPDQWETVAAALGVAVGVAQTVFTVLKPTGIFDWIEFESTIRTSPGKHIKE